MAIHLLLQCKGFFNLQNKSLHRTEYSRVTVLRHTKEIQTSTNWRLWSKCNGVTTLKKPYDRVFREVRRRMEIDKNSAGLIDKIWHDNPIFSKSRSLRKRHRNTSTIDVAFIAIATVDLARWLSKANHMVKFNFSDRDEWIRNYLKMERKTAGNITKMWIICKQQKRCKYTCPLVVFVPSGTKHLRV